MSPSSTKQQGTRCGRPSLSMVANRATGHAAACRRRSSSPSMREPYRYADATMLAVDSPPFRADHVGSLLRPPALLGARAAHAAGDLSGDELRALEDDAIRAVVAMQEDVGLRAATDGEF